MLKQLNERPFQKLPGSRASAFATLDAPAIQTVPARRYEIATFKTVKVNIDYHVAVEKHRYSVPHALVGETLEAHITRTAIELLRRGQRIACHARKSRVGGFSTVVGQMPAAHRAYMEWTPQRMIDWGARSARSGGVRTRLLGENRHPEHGYGTCLGLLQLAKRNGKVRLEAACALAL